MTIIAEYGTLPLLALPTVTTRVGRRFHYASCCDDVVILIDVIRDVNGRHGGLARVCTVQRISLRVSNATQ